ADGGLARLHVERRGARHVRREENGEEERRPRHAAPVARATRRARSRKKRRSGRSYGSCVEISRRSTPVRRIVSRVRRADASARSAYALRTRGLDASTSFRAPVSGSSTATIPTGGSVLSRGSETEIATTSCLRATTRSVRSYPSSWKSETRK